MARTFDDVQAFFEFLTVLNDVTKRVTTEGVTVDLLTNLDPSGKTNLAIELAKIYSWYQNMVDYNPSTHEFTIKPAAIPNDAKNTVEGYYDPATEKFYEDSAFTTEMEAVGDRIYIEKTSNMMFRYDTTDARYESLSGNDTTYAFREGTTDGAFEVEELGSLPQSIKVHNVATLDSNGKVPSSQLPSYVDDVIEGYLVYDLLTAEPSSFDPTKYFKLVDGEYVRGQAGEAWAADTWYEQGFYEDQAHTTKITPESGKIYVDLVSNKTYRWGGTVYAEIPESLALGETSSTAYRGDRGKIAYDHSQLTSGNPHHVTKSDVGLGNVDNTADADKNVLSATKLTTPATIDGVSFDGSAGIFHYGVCSTAAATTTKVVACTGFTKVTGAWIAVKFTVTNTGAVGSLQLDVNGTGGAPIKYRNANLPDVSTLTAQRVYLFVYDGTNYQLVGDLDTTIANTDIHMRQRLITTTDAKLRPLLMSYAETSSSTTDVDNLGYRMNTVYVDTTTGTIHVPGVVSDKIVSDDIETTTGEHYVHTGDVLILHCNSRPELLS
jgi:hypothetical protein